MFGVAVVRRSDEGDLDSFAKEQLEEFRVAVYIERLIQTESSSWNPWRA